MTKKVYVVLADPSGSSNVAKAVYLDKEAADKWAEKENKKLGCYFYWVEESPLIE